MGNQTKRNKEKRKIALTWLDTAATLTPGKTLFIPMRHSAERYSLKKICEDIVKDMESSFESSIYHGIKVFSTCRGGVLYLAFEKAKLFFTTAYIRDRASKDKQLKILKVSRHTRRTQIILMLEEGYTKDEIRVALGKKITPQEESLLQ